MVLKTPIQIHRRSYINRYLSSSYLNDKDTFLNGILLLGYIISKMPTQLKVLFLKCHSLVTNNNN
jgi:hypothetical protein